LKNAFSGVLFSVSNGFEVSLDSTKFFAPSFKVSGTKLATDLTVNIFVRAKADSIGLSSTGALTVSGDGITTQTFPIEKTGCDSSIFTKGSIASFLAGGTICLKDSLLLTATSSTGFYLWSNGDTTRTTKITNPGNIFVRTAVKAGCFNLASPAVNVLKNTAPTPVLSLTRDSVLSTQMAPQYKWYRNNRVLNGLNSNTYTAQNIGLYKVETSSNGVCWDGSNEVPIFTLPTRSNNDTLLLRVYPNPSSGDFTVQASLQNPTNVTARILITDMGGTSIIQNTRFIFFGREIRIPVTIVNKGTYVVRMEMNGQIKTVNVIVQ